MAADVRDCAPSLFLALDGRTAQPESEGYSGSGRRIRWPAQWHLEGNTRREPARYATQRLFHAFANGSCISFVLPRNDRARCLLTLLASFSYQVSSCQIFSSCEAASMTGTAQLNGTQLWPARRRGLCTRAYRRAISLVA